MDRALAASVLQLVEDVTLDKHLVRRGDDPQVLADAGDGQQALDLLLDAGQGEPLLALL